MPVAFWDVWASRATRARDDLDMGLCSRALLNLNDTQEGVLSIAFKVADDNGSC